MHKVDRSYFAPTAVGKTRRLLPNGFLLCEGVPVARVGTQTYSAAELPGLQPGPDGKIHVERLPEEVFHRDTIASFEAATVTVHHPREFVNPANWKALSVGHTQNLRRGEGDEADLLLADVIVEDAAAISQTMAKLPQVSCGYDANYVPTGIPGHYYQRLIRGNHVALLPNARGRAGDRCSIRDHALKEPTMHTLTHDIQRLFSTAPAEAYARNLQRGRAGASGTAQTRDELLTPMTSERPIPSLGTQWTGSSINPHVDNAVQTVRKFLRGFVLGNIVGAEDVPIVINAGRMLASQIPVGETRSEFDKLLAEAEKKAFSKSGPVTDEALLPGWSGKNLVARTFTPEDSMGTTDSIRRLFSSRPSELYTQRLQAGRKTMDATAPAKVRTPGDYAASLAAGRAAMGR